MSLGQEVAVACDVLHMNSPLLRDFPWYTGVVLKLPNFSGNVGRDNLELFLSTLDKSETTLLFTNNACCNPQDHDIQSMLGIRVDNAMQTISSQPHALVERLGNLRAGFLFSVLARYHLVDVVALMEGVYLNPTPVPRSRLPMGVIPVCQFLILPLFSILRSPAFRSNGGLGKCDG